MLFPEKAGGGRIHTGKHRTARTGSTCYCFGLLLTTSGVVVSFKPLQQKGIFMSHIHSREHMDDGNVVTVQCSHQINVLLMDDSNYSSYKRGGRCTYYGGFYERFPANIAVPHSGFWNVVLALPAGHRANIRYSINVI
jgi:hypothetical protein